MGAEIESLKLAFSTNTKWSELATLAVFIGLLGDILVILIFDFSDKDKTWTEITLAGIASLVIAFGVWGEYRFGHRATEAASQLQANSETQIALLNSAAAKLNKDAADARREQAAIENENLKLRGTLQSFGSDMAREHNRLKDADVRIAKLNKETVVARKQIADAESQAAKSNEKAEAERLERVRLEQAIAWRTLTEEQRQRIVGALKSFAGERLQILVSPFEPDALPFAEKIGTALSTSWTKKSSSGVSLTFRLKWSHWWWHWQQDPLDSSWIPIPGAGWIVHADIEPESPAFVRGNLTVHLNGTHGLIVITLPNATGRDLAAANALACALAAEHFDIGAPSPMEYELRDTGLMFDDMDSSARTALLRRVESASAVKSQLRGWPFLWK